MKNIPTYLPVVAAAIAGKDGTWLMHRRAFRKDHGGLWEFPGGKVEVDEMPGEALMRELHEELGIGVNDGDIDPVCFAESQQIEEAIPIVIMLYKVSRYTGEPAALEGEGIAWCNHQEIADLEKPPLDIALAARLRQVFP